MEESEFIRDSKFFLITHDELDQLVYILAILLTIAPKIEYQLQINTLEQNWVKLFLTFAKRRMGQQRSPSHENEKHRTLHSHSLMSGFYIYVPSKTQSLS